MNTRLSARELAMALCSRSACKVQVAAVLADGRGIFAWGWNHAIVDSADGFGVHAEQHAFLRANRKRLRGARLVVAGRRRRNDKWLCARPCAEFCLELARKHGIAVMEYTNKNGWSVERIS